MPISMSISARYVTQSSVYGTVYKGRLTDRKIRQYQAKGFYGTNGILAQSKEKTRVRLRSERAIKRTTEKELTKLYVF